MKRKFLLSSEGKITTVCLIVAAAAVLVQIISGHPYPTILPVFFILLIPAALIYFAPWGWTPISAILSGIFLTAGLFLRGCLKTIQHNSYGGQIYHCHICVIKPFIIF